MGDIAETITKQIADSPAAEAIRRSWFGTLLGQTTTAVLLVLGLLTAITQLLPVLDQIENLHPVLRYGIHAFVGLSLAVVLIFSVLPATFRAIRQRRLAALTRNPAPARPGHFRITPYDESDSAVYARPDGAVERALHWIKAAQLPVLYLTGASGAGKTSLVNAGLLPTLKRQGWAVVTLRGLGQPLANLTAALRARGDLYARTPPKTADARALLTLAGKERLRAGAAPLLVVLDQFEEYLILDSLEERRAYADFLTALQAAPIPGIRLLHVLREDYRPLLFQQDLPRLIPGETGFELAPFTAGDAQAFLSAGPVKLDEAGYARLLDGLDRIETTPGLYRPITLNMIGHVLEREGSGAALDPARLIENYLRRCITGGVSRDHTRPLLDAMITPAGTRQPATLADLQSRSGIPRPLIESTLLDLQRDGLVRPLSGDRWEISHDFLAALLGRITGKLRAPWLQRAALPAIGLTAAAWIVVVAVLVPMWMREAALRELQKLSIVQVNSGEKGDWFVVKNPEDLDDDAWARAVPALKVFNVTSLDLNGVKVTRLAGIENLSKLQILNMSDSEISSMEGINQIRHLQRLDLSGSKIKDISGIERLTDLQILNIASTDVSAFDGIENLKELWWLNLNFTNIQTLPGIEDLSNLESLSLAGTRVIAFSGMEKLSGLHQLDLSYTWIGSLHGISSLRNLQELRLVAAPIMTLSEIENLEQLTYLDLTHSQIRYISGVENMKSLRTLVLENPETYYAPPWFLMGVFPLSPEAPVPKTYIASLANIDCTKLEIIASDELLATCGP